VEVVIEEATDATGEVVAAVQRLVPMLSATAPVPTEGEVRALVESPATVLLLARAGGGGDTGGGTGGGTGGEIVGMLTLALFRIPTGLRAWIEDVVVDTTTARRGIGTALTEAALRRAAEAGARTVDLTSRPARQAANGLYQKVGFARRDTNVYRYQL
jgi:ribosomal protein S18 acetylase RimI-like enzyme